MKHRAKRKKHKPKGHHRKSSGKHHRKPPPYHSRAPPLSFVQIQQILHKRVKLFFERCKKLARLTSIMDGERRCNGFER